MKYVSGRLSRPVTRPICGPMPSGTVSTSHLAMWSTMPVPERTPVKTAAAKTMPETLRTLSAWAAMRAFWSGIRGKLTVRASAAPIRKSTGIGSSSMIMAVSSATVSSALNQYSLGRRVGRFGSRPLKSSPDSASDPASRSAASPAPPVPAPPRAAPAPAPAPERPPDAPPDAPAPTSTVSVSVSGSRTSASSSDSVPTRLRSRRPST